MKIKMKFIVYMAGFCALLVGLVSVGRSFGFLQSEAPKVVPYYLAVTRDLKVGDFLEAKDMEWRPAIELASPEAATSYTPKGALNPADLAGAVLRSDVARNSFLATYDYIKPGESAFLAAVLRPDKRAITIRVDDVTGGAGLIRPGNQVDVVLSGKLESGGAAKGLPSAKTLLTDVRVIAVNRDVDPRAVNPAQEKDKVTRGGSQDVARGTVTLEGTAQEVEIITVARKLGELSLSLRSLENGVAKKAVPTQMTKAHDVVKMAGPGSDVVSIYGTEVNKASQK